MGNKRNGKQKLNWTVTPWEMNGLGGWKQQPVILVEGREPFYTDHPDEYIAKLEELHTDLSLLRGAFYTFIGQFKDGLDNAWAPLEKVK